MSSLIQPENTWVLWAILVCIAAGSIFLEQTYKWAAKMTGCVLALLGTMLLANLRIIPTESPVYDDVWGYVVPLAIPLLLFQCNIRKIGRESGRLLVLYLLSSIGTVGGAFLGFFLLRGLDPNLNQAAAMFAGTYVGGSVNFAAMADSFHVSGEFVSAAVIADNLLMALYFFALIAIPALSFFRKHFRHPIIDNLEANKHTSGASSYWKAQPISLKDIAFDFAAAVAIVAIATTIADFFAGIIPTDSAFTNALNLLLGNKYLIMTTITMCCATFLPNLFGKAPGANEIGTFLIYIFFAVIGAPASIQQILSEIPLLLYALVIVSINLAFTLLVGKLFHFDLEEIILASNANIGGPTTAAAMAISKGWESLVGPVLLIGTLGYVLGNYYGILVGNILK